MGKPLIVIPIAMLASWGLVAAAAVVLAHF
jgi:hypothetical protein